MIRNYCLALLFIVSPLFLFAQQGTVKGFVMDDAGSVLSFANVKVGKNGMQSDMDGYFEIKADSGAVNISISNVGYETYKTTVKVEAGKTVNLGNVILKKGTTLNEFEVNEENTIKKEETRVSVITMTSEDIKKVPVTMGDNDIVQALLVQPSVTSTGDQGGQLYIRGGTPIQNKVLMDGAVIYNPFHSIGLLSVFDTDLIRSADIYTGGFGAEYGGRLSSVMDIKLRDGNKKRFSGIVGLNPVNAKIILEGPIKKLKEDGGASASFLVSARGSFLEYSSRVFYPYANVTPGNSVTTGLPYNFYDILGKISINAGGSGSRINLFGFSQNDFVNFNSITSFNWKAAGGGINFLVVPGSTNVKIDGSLAYSNYVIEMLENNDQNLKRNSSINAFNLNLNFSQFLGVHKMMYGLEAVGTFTTLLYDTPYSTRIENNNNTTELAGYVKGKFIKWGFVFEPSVRLHYYASISEFSPEPRLSIKYNATDWMRVKLAGGMYSQNLVAANSDRDVVNLFYGFLSGVQDLPKTFRGNDVTSKLSKSQHAILGFEFDLGKHVDINLEGYYINFSQLLNVNRNKQFDIDAQGVPDYLKYDIIIEDGYAAGGDVTVKFEYKNFYLWTVYSLITIKRNDEIITYTPQFNRTHNLNIVANYKFGKNKDWEVSARWNLGSGFPFTQNQGFYQALDFQGGINTDYTTSQGTLGIIYGDINTGTLPWYHRLDFNIRKTFKFGENMKLELNAGASNLYNRRNIFYLDRVSFQKIYQLPIIYNIGAQFTF